MKILFLDVDGVLNTWDNPTLQEEKLLLLKEIVEKSGCEIVLSSAWRLHYPDLIKLGEKFEQYNIPLWIDETPNLPYERYYRSDEIKLWIDKNLDKITLGVVLDDDEDARPYGSFPVKCGFVLTDRNTGLTVNQTQRIISFFTR